MDWRGRPVLRAQQYVVGAQAAPRACRLFFRALHGLVVQPLGMHARAHELVAQCLGRVGGIGPGARAGQSGQRHADGDEENQAFKNSCHE